MFFSVFLVIVGVLTGCASQDPGVRFSFDSLKHDGTPPELLFLGIDGSYYFARRPGPDSSPFGEVWQAFPDEIAGRELQSVNAAVWSPSGNAVAAAGQHRGDRQWPEARVVMVVFPDTGEGLVVWRRTDRTPFFLSFAPTGDMLAVLSSNADGMLELEVVPVQGRSLGEDRSQQIIARGAPLYFDWFPDSQAIAVATGGVLSAVEVGSGEETVLSTNLSGGRAPAVRPDGEAIATVVRTARGPAVVSVDLRGRVLPHQAAPAGAAVAWHPTEPYLATLRFAPAGGIGVVSVVDTAATTRTVSEGFPAGVGIEEQPALAMEWLADGSGLMILGPARPARPEEPLQWRVARRGSEGWRSQAVTGVAPSPAQMQSWLPFFDQYGRTSRRSSPDGMSWVYESVGARNRPVIRVASLKSGDSIPVGLGVLPLWRPGTRRPAVAIPPDTGNALERWFPRHSQL